MAGNPILMTLKNDMIFEIIDDKEERKDVTAVLLEMGKVLALYIVNRRDALLDDECLEELVGMMRGFFTSSRITRYKRYNEQGLKEALTAEWIMNVPPTKSKFIVKTLKAIILDVNSDGTVVFNEDNIAKYKTLTRKGTLTYGTEDYVKA